MRRSAQFQKCDTHPDNGGHSFDKRISKIRMTILSKIVIRTLSQSDLVVNRDDYFPGCHNGSASPRW